ncbi:MAG: cob(I)yrinic acid a,c-diamide adenosyltransferase [Chloroflexi bacterium RBG_16_56_11]|nr:MAG: cob(I)yrinic acid a,c-diamide adenosyltransferase [Chloroflexi bacterium RBG_16_56_11]
MADKKQQGLVQVFTGNGKGKTTAALGAVLRAAGHDWKIYIVFFFKGKRDSGEFTSLSKFPNVVLSRFGLRPFADPADITPTEKEQARRALAAASEAVTSGRYDLVVLDEVNVALDYKLVSLDDVLRLVREKPSHVELILTGRHADNRLLEAADLVTEMVKVKHPFDKGIKARKGIEY